MVAAGLFQKWSAWPKWIWIKLYARFVRATLTQRYLNVTTMPPPDIDDRSRSGSPMPSIPSVPGDPQGLDRYFLSSNINMVSYSCHSPTSQPSGWVTPIHFLSADARSFRRLESLSNIIVDYEDRPLTASTPATTAVSVASATVSSSITTTSSSPSTTKASVSVSEHGDRGSERIAILRSQAPARPYLPDASSGRTDQVAQFIQRWWKKII
jgi:hypothetical protein